MLRVLIPVAVAMLTLASVGCDVVVLDKPLIAAKDAELPMDLIGEYKPKPTDGARDFGNLIIEDAGEKLPDGFFVLTFRSQDRRQQQQLLGFVLRADECYYLHIPMPRQNSLSELLVVDEAEWLAGNYDGFVVVRVRLDGDEIQCNMLRFNEIKQAVSRGDLAGNLKNDSTDPEHNPSEPKQVRLAGTPNEILAYFKKNQTAIVDGQKTLTWTRK